MDEPGRIGIFRPLKFRDFRLLWTGLAVSLLGDGIYLVAIAWQVYLLSNSPSALALVGLAWTLPTVVLVLLSGVLTDRLPRRRMMLMADVIRGLAIATMGILTISGAVRLWQLVLLAAVYGSGEALFGPANTAIVPELVPSQMLMEANSLSQFVRPFAAVLVGPAVGGLLVGTVGAGWAFVADAGTFAFSFVMIMLMRDRPSVRDPDATTSAWNDLTDGFRYVRSQTWLLISMSVATVALLCFWGPFEVLVPYVVKNDLGESAIALGLVFAAGGVGAVIAAGVAGQRPMSRRPFTLMYVAWAVGTFALVGFGVSPVLWPMFLVSALCQACFTILLINWYTLVQKLVPAQMLGRVTSLDWLISIAGVPISFALTGPIAKRIGPRPTLVWAGVLGALVIVVAVVSIPGARGPERDGSLAESSTDPG